MPTNTTFTTTFLCVYIEKSEFDMVFLLSLQKKWLLPVGSFIFFVVINRSQRLILQFFCWIYLRTSVDLSRNRFHDISIVFVQMFEKSKANIVFWLEIMLYNVDLCKNVPLVSRTSLFLYASRIKLSILKTINSSDTKMICRIC